MSQLSEFPRSIHANIGTNIESQVKTYHQNVITEITQHVNNDTVVVVGMAWNPFVKRARKALSNVQIDYTYLEYGSYVSQWKPRLAIKMWSGWPTFPQVFVKGSLIGGATDLEKLIESGEIKQLLSAS